jgi:ABC-type Mn2+/Zn2+ transport system ATPase subunit
MRLESVGKRYGPRQPWIVRDVSLDAAPGTLIRLEGRNGSGKSTLLRVVAGVSRPSKGTVTGRPHTGYVPERFPGALPFSGREYLLHMARIHGLRGAAAAKRVDDWLERLGAADYAGQPLRSLSKGMCQKIAITQALLPEPGLLILDEAWTGLDQAARGALEAAALERVADGGTVLFVDHEQARLAGKIGQRWQFDGSGRVTVAQGPPVTSAGNSTGNGIVRTTAARSDEVLRALLRYQSAILLRSYRWIFPLMAYAVLVAAGNAGAGTDPLSGGLGWSAAMLVPVVAFLTRSMLTAEPDAARACAAAAAGPVKAQVAALLTAVGGGVALAIAGAVLEVITSESVLESPASPTAWDKVTATASHPKVLLAGLATALVCLLVASAAGALLNPPLVRHPGLAILSTLTAVIVALASDVSPAGAALRNSGAPSGPHWPGTGNFIAALCLAAVTWTASSFAAARRDNRSPGT